MGDVAANVREKYSNFDWACWISDWLLKRINDHHAQELVRVIAVWQLALCPLVMKGSVSNSIIQCMIQCI